MNTKNKDFKEFISAYSQWLACILNMRHVQKHVYALKATFIPIRQDKTSMLSMQIYLSKFGSSTMSAGHEEVLVKYQERLSEYIAAVSDDL